MQGVWTLWYARSRLEVESVGVGWKMCSMRYDKN